MVKTRKSVRIGFKKVHRTVGTDLKSKWNEWKWNKGKQLINKTN